MLYYTVSVNNQITINKSKNISSGNAFLSGAGDLRFKSRAGQIGHSVADGSPPLRHFFERSSVARRLNYPEIDPVNSSHALA